MPRYVEHQSTPGKAWPVINGHCRSGKALRGNFDQLQKSLHSVQNAERRGRLQVHALGCNLQMVRLIFFQLLHWRARTRGLDEELRLVQLRLAPEWDSRLPRKNIQKALLRPFQPRLLIAFKNDAEAVIDDKLTRTGLNLGRHRHQGKRCCGLSVKGGAPAE